MTWTNPELNAGPAPREAWGAPGWPEAPMTALVGGRYQIRHPVARGALLAQDLWLRHPVLLRLVGAGGRLAAWGWRRQAQTLAARRHPNFLNLYGLRRDGRAELMVTDCPRGPSLEALLREGVRFELEDAVRLLPLTALDLTAALTGSRDGPRLGGVFIEPREGSVRPEEFVRQAPGDWPAFVTRLDVWDLARPGRAWRDRWRPGGGEEGPWGARYAALLTYGLLAGRPRRGWGGAWGRGPLGQLSGEANGLLRAVLRGRRRFASSEEFLAALERANRPGAPGGEEAAAAAGAPAGAGEGSSRARPRGWAWPRATAAAAAALALVLAAALYERSQPGLPWGRPTGGFLTFRADPADAKVLLDGADMGTSGFVQRRLSVGAHSLVLARSGFQTKELSFEVKPGEAEDLGTLALLPEGGDLSIGADLPATPFEVVGPKDEKLTGVTPGKLSQVPPGVYTVHLRPPGWPEYTQTIEVKAGQGVAATHDFGEAVPVIPLLPTNPVPLLQMDKADELSDLDDEDVPAKTRRPRTPRPVLLPKAEAFRRFDAKWDAKERSVQTQISVLDKRIAGASGPRRDRLRADRADLERNRNYIRDMRRYERGQLRHKYGEPDGVWNSIRNVFGL